MNKYQRKIDYDKVEQSKSKSIDMVMNEINKEDKSFSIYKSIKPTLISALGIIILLVVIFTSSDPANPDDQIILSAFESQKLAEISYVTSNLISSNVQVNNNLLTQLSTLEITEFEDNDELINLYFDTLKVFLEDETFNDSVTITILEDNEFDQLLEFEIDGVMYQFYISIVDSDILGELIVENTIYEVTGKFEETETELSIEIEAVFGNDFIIIKYKTESEDDIETKYEVHKRIQNIETYSEIKVSHEEDEVKVEIIEGQNEYTLKKETENGNNKYKLEYKINGVSGEAEITEEEDAQGNISYNYQIKEGDEEKEIHHGKPDYDYEEDEEDEDEEDEEDENNRNNGNNGNGEGNNQNQSSYREINLENKTL